jgi:hypothetical protein
MVRQLVSAGSEQAENMRLAGPTPSKQDLVIARFQLPQDAEIHESALEYTDTELLVGIGDNAGDGATYERVRDN